MSDETAFETAFLRFSGSLGRCPKCTSAAKATRWNHPALERECSLCGYKWAELPADATRQPPPLPATTLPTRARKALQRLKWDGTAEGAARISESAIHHTKNAGYRTVSDIKEWLDSHGMSLSKPCGACGGAWGVEACLTCGGTGGTPPPGHAPPALPDAAAAAAMMGRPVADLGLSVRAINALDCQGAATVADVCGKTPDELLRGRYMGQATLREITAALARHGLRLLDAVK